VKRVHLDVQQKNIRAINFYKKLGFIIIGEESQPFVEGRKDYFKMELMLPVESNWK